LERRACARSGAGGILGGPTLCAPAGGPGVELSPIGGTHIKARRMRRDVTLGPAWIGLADVVVSLLCSQPIGLAESG